MAQLEVVIMAAGKGSRMQSNTPKVLHSIAGKPMLLHVLLVAAELRPARIHLVVSAGQIEAVEKLAASVEVACRCHVQERPDGTGGALQKALDTIADSSTVLVLNGDTPLIRSSSLQLLIQGQRRSDLCILTAKRADPAALGRVLRSPQTGLPVRIVEARNADEQQLLGTEIYTGACVAGAADLRAWLDQVKVDARSGERYLTDLVQLAADAGAVLEAFCLADEMESLGVNDRVDLASAECAMQKRLANHLMCAGATVADPGRLTIRGTVEVGRDCFIDVGVVLEGVVRIGSEARIHAYSVLRDCTIGEGAIIEPYSHVTACAIGPGARVGPYARIRMGTQIGADAQIGNFVEAKNAKIHSGVNAKHHAYLGDVTVGADSNIGAGVIVANYDGKCKKPTRIGERVFVGSNATLIAELDVAEDAHVAAGSTISGKVDAGTMAVSRSAQRTLSARAVRLLQRVQDVRNAATRP